MKTYEPVDDEDAQSLIGEGVHTGLRKGTDASGSADVWQAIALKDSGWPDAVAYAVEGLRSMGFVLCKVVDDA